MPGFLGRQRPAHPFRRVVLLLSLSLVMALLDARGNIGPLVVLRNVVVSAVSPLQSAAFQLSLPLANFMEDWSTVGSKDEQIAKLREENEGLQQQLLSGEDKARRAAELDALLQTAGTGDLRIVMARVMSIGSASGFGSTVLIDAGAADGIKKDMTVMAGAGMVGRVLSTTSHTSVVVLMVDATSIIGARVAGSGEVGFLSGLGSADNLSLEFIDPKAKVKVGDRLVSYGVTGGIFTSGIPLGVVTRVEAQVGTTNRRADVKPYVDVTALDLVGVIVAKPRQDPRDSLLPTATAIPTVTVTVTEPAPGDVTPSGTISATGGTP